MAGQKGPWENHHPQRSSTTSTARPLVEIEGQVVALLLEFGLVPPSEDPFNWGFKFRSSADLPIACENGTCQDLNI